MRRRVGHTLLLENVPLKGWQYVTAAESQHKSSTSRRIALTAVPTKQQVHLRAATEADHTMRGFKLGYSVLKSRHI